MSTRDGTIFVSAAKTATEYSEPISSRGLKFLILYVDVTAIAATPSVTFSVQALDPASGKWFTIWTAAAALTAVSTAIYALGPGLLDSVPGGYTDVENIVLPPTLRVTRTHADTDSFTSSTGYALTG